MLIDTEPADFSMVSVYREMNGAADDDEIVERDPSGRFVRYNHLIGRGATKRVYKGFDLHEGVEVAWNQIDLNPSDSDRETTDRLFEEISLLKKLKHKRIMSFYDWYYDAKHKTLNFMTEYFPSGTLRQYRKRFQKVVTVSIIKRWAWQILEGLVYLHGHYPPIIHRDVKADNIFVNSTSGQVKIGDLGLATAHRGLSVVGTPEFMAPEVYEERYDEKADIYSFGMCLLELATLEYPYAECRGIAQIYRKVSQGIPPAGLDKVMCSELREFIELCISFTPESRPSARQLLRHTFFDDVRPAICKVSTPTSPASSSTVSPSSSNIPDVPFPDTSPTGSISSARSPMPATRHQPPAPASPFSKCQDHTVSVDLSRSMYVKFGEEPGLMDGTSSDDEVLIPVAALQPSRAASYFRSQSDSTTMGRSADAATESMDSEQRDSVSCQRSSSMQMLVRRKLLEDSRLAAEMSHPWCVMMISKLVARFSNRHEGREPSIISKLIARFYPP